MASIWGLVAKIIPTLSSLNIDVINFVKSNTLVNANSLNDILNKNGVFNIINITIKVLLNATSSVPNGPVKRPQQILQAVRTAQHRPRMPPRVGLSSTEPASATSSVPNRTVRKR